MSELNLYSLLFLIYFINILTCSSSLIQSFKQLSIYLNVNGLKDLVC